MDNQYYYDRLHELNKLKTAALNRRVSFFQYILLASVSILGITASLHNNSLPDLYIRYLFVASISLLSLGVLTCAIVLYEVQRMEDILQQKYYREIHNALSENRKVEPAFAGESKMLTICQPLTLVFLTLGLVALSAYTCLSVFI